MTNQNTLSETDGPDSLHVQTEPLQNKKNIYTDFMHKNIEAWQTPISALLDKKSKHTKQQDPIKNVNQVLNLLTDQICC